MYTYIVKIRFDFGLLPDVRYELTLRCVWTNDKRDGNPDLLWIKIRKQYGD